MKKLYRLESAGGMGHVAHSVRVFPMPDACPVCAGRLVEDDTTRRVYCEAAPDHTPPDLWEHTAYELPEADTGKGHGFAWSYAGTSPAILAASLVADVFGEQFTEVQWRSGACRSWMHMQGVKDRFLVPLRRDLDVHVLDSEAIRAYCLEREEPCELCKGEGSITYDDGPDPVLTEPCFACLGLRVQRRREDA